MLCCLCVWSRLSVCGAGDESQVDWTALARVWPACRSPHWLRGKWWNLKRRLPPSVQELGLSGESLRTLFFFCIVNVKVNFLYEYSVSETLYHLVMHQFISISMCVAVLFSAFFLIGNETFLNI